MSERGGRPRSPLLRVGSAPRIAKNGTHLFPLVFFLLYILCCRRGCCRRFRLLHFFMNIEHPVNTKIPMIFLIHCAFVLSSTLLPRSYSLRFVVYLFVFRSCWSLLSGFIMLGLFCASCISFHYVRVVGLALSASHVLPPTTFLVITNILILGGLCLGNIVLTRVAFGCCPWVSLRLI